MNYLLSFIAIFLFNHALYAEVSDCSSQMIQVMKPAHPDTSYQGFAVVKFNIDTSGKPKNIKAINSFLFSSSFPSSYYLYYYLHWILQLVIFVSPMLYHQLNIQMELQTLYYQLLYISHQFL